MSVNRTARELARHILYRLGAMSLLRRDLTHLQGDSLQDRFTEIYRTGFWRDGKDENPLSGAGSSLGATENLRGELPTLLNELGVQVLLDVGCGDFTWMSTVDLGKVHYTGVDIVPNVIAEHLTKHSSDTRHFAVANAVTDALPDADAIMCREVLFHLSFDDVRSVLRNMVNTEARYCLLTSDRGTSINSDIRSGDHRLLNLQRAPFLLPPPIKLIEEGASLPGRFLGCWTTAQLRRAI
jgi:hypothetical protein